MVGRMTARPLALLVAVAPLIHGCGQQPAAQQDLAGLDRELTAATTANARDPALTASLGDQIMVDPALAQSANADVIRPPARPDPGSVPVVANGGGADPAGLKTAPAARPDCPECRAAAGALTLGELAARQTNRTMAGCANRLTYSAGWANRLPADMPLYPDARIDEAAGADGCGLRVVSFASAAPTTRVIDYYYTKVTSVGYSAERKAANGMDVLGGTRGEAAYMIYVSARPGGGSAVDLVSNAGD